MIAVSFTVPRPRPDALTVESGVRVGSKGCATLFERPLAGCYGPSPARSHLDRLARVRQAVSELVAEGVSQLDAVLVADRCRRIDPGFSDDALSAVLADAIAPLREHAEIVLGHAAGRRALALLSDAQRAIAEGQDPYAVAGDAAKALDAVGTPAGDRPEALTMAELVESADKVAPWVVPGLLRLDWRCVVVAPEGSGKSTLLRQLGVLGAQGLHPLTFRPIPPVRALVVDAENSRAAIAETGASQDALARRLAGDRYDGSALPHLVPPRWARPEGPQGPGRPGA